MRWIYFGTGVLSARFLEKLIDRRLLPKLVITGSSKPAGRGRKIAHTPVFMIAHDKGLPVIETKSLDDPVIIKKVQMESPSFFVVFDFGQIVPPGILSIPRIAPLNVHPSLLPRYRGAAPIIRAMMAGEKYTGITIIKMNEKIDAGDIVLQEKIEIPEGITRGELEEIILDKGCELIAKSFSGLKEGTITPHPQTGKPTYARKLSKEELWINWEEDAQKIKNQILALSPIPGARSTFKGRIIQFLKVNIPENLSINIRPGEIFVKDKKLYVGTGSIPIEVLIVKPSGKRELTAQEFINGYRPHNLYFTSR